MNSVSVVCNDDLRSLTVLHGLEVLGFYLLTVKIKINFQGWVDFFHEIHIADIGQKWNKSRVSSIVQFLNTLNHVYFLHKCYSKKRRFKWQLNCYVIPKVQLTVSKEIGHLTPAPASNIKYIRGNEKIPIWSYLNWLERCERNIRPYYDAFILIWNTHIVESDFVSQLLLWHRKLVQMGSLTKALEYLFHKQGLKREFNKDWMEASE